MTIVLIKIINVMLELLKYGLVVYGLIGKLMVGLYMVIYRVRYDRGEIPSVHRLT